MPLANVLLGYGAYKMKKLLNAKGGLESKIGKPVKKKRKKKKSKLSLISHQSQRQLDKLEDK